MSPGTESATCPGGMSTLPGSVGPPPAAWCRQIVGAFQMCEGWSRFTQRPLRVFLTAESENTHEGPPRREGGRPGCFNIRYSVSYVDTKLFASCKQSRQSPLMSVWPYEEFKRDRKYSKCWV